MLKGPPYVPEGAGQGELGRASQERSWHIEDLRPSLKHNLEGHGYHGPYGSDVELYLDEYEKQLSRIEEKSDEVPPEWVKQAAEARKIQAEIREKLAQLEGFFQLKGPHRVWLDNQDN